MSEHGRGPDGAWPHRAWRGYHPRAAVPAVLAAAACSLVLMVGRWHTPEMSDLADRVGAWVFFLLTAGVWAGLLARAAYRLVMFTYVLTDRALLVEFGPAFRPVPAVLFKDVTGVAHGANAVDRLLGVGWVTVTAGPRQVTLLGVRKAPAFAAAVRAAANTSRTAHP